jgi:hypothetical protein
MHQRQDDVTQSAFAVAFTHITIATKQKSTAKAVPIFLPLSTFNC